MRAGSVSHSLSAGCGLFIRKVAPLAAFFRKSNRFSSVGWCSARKFALVIRYVDLIGRGPKRRWEMVEEPAFLESYTK